MENATGDFHLVLDKLQSYFSHDKERLTWEILDWLYELPAFAETQEFIGVHAGVPLDVDGKIKPLKNASVERLVYDRNFKNADTYINDKRMVLYGHTPTSYLGRVGEIIKYPRQNGNGYARIHLDTGAYLTGVLGCYCFDTDSCFYVRKEN